MIDFEIFRTETGDVQRQLNLLLERKLGKNFRIGRTENGKPFVEGNPLYFSISHSSDQAVIAICERPIGIDLELIRDRKYAAVLSRFHPEERNEIFDRESFLKHWVVREAYIKMLGSTLAEKLNKLRFIGGVLYDGGQPADCEITLGVENGCVYGICIDKHT